MGPHGKQEDQKRGYKHATTLSPDDNNRREPITRDTPQTGPSITGRARPKRDTPAILRTVRHPSQKKLVQLPQGRAVTRLRLHKAPNARHQPPGIHVGKKGLKKADTKTQETGATPTIKRHAHLLVPLPPPSPPLSLPRPTGRQQKGARQNPTNSTTPPRNPQQPGTTPTTAEASPVSSSKWFAGSGKELRKQLGKQICFDQMFCRVFSCFFRVLHGCVGHYGC